MCGICGCGDAGAEACAADDGRRTREHAHERHDHGHPAHEHGSDGALSFGSASVGVHSGERDRLVEIERDVFAKNYALAAANRARLARDGVLAVNLMSSPGAGKTTLLVKTIEALTGAAPVAVIEGDQQTSRDAERIRAAGAPAIQVNTGPICHLDAEMVGAALDHLAPPRDGIVFIENVGNLVCPAGFDLGEARRIVLVSVTEGDDKPLKYPNMFATADLVLVTKTDLLAHVEFDVDAVVAGARRVRPRVDVMRVSARSGAGMEAWLAWLSAAHAQRRAAAG